MECRELHPDVTASRADLKGAFILPWPYPHGIESFQKSVVDRFNLSEITSMYYFDGFDVMCLKSDDDLQVCLGYFKRCSLTYRNWMGLCKIYIVMTHFPDVNSKHASPGQTENEMAISMCFSELVYHIIESYSTATLFQSMDSREENVLRFALRVHSKYGNNFVVINEDVVFCNACKKSVKLNKVLQLINVDEHVKRHNCCKEKDMLGMYLWAMGAHVAKMKSKLLALFNRISVQQDDEIRKPIRKLYSMPQDILSQIESIEKLLEERSTANCEIYLELLNNVKKFIKPWNSYEELRKTADTQKRVEVTISMKGIDEA